MRLSAHMNARRPLGYTPAYAKLGAKQPARKSA
jgi:hypothetical protein